MSRTCSLCGAGVAYPHTTCSVCRGAHRFTTEEVAAAFGVPIESLCAHEFEKAHQSGFTTQWWRCKHCGAEKRSNIAGATPAAHTITAEHQVGADAQTALGRAKEDARMFGVGFVVDGKRVSPQSVVVVREPNRKSEDDQVLELALRSMSNHLNDLAAECADGDQVKAPSRKGLMRARGVLPPYCSMALAGAKPAESFDDFWLREGPSLAWDEDRKRAARRIWDAARK